MNRFYKFYRPLVMLLPPEAAHKIAHIAFKALYPVPKIHIKDPLLATQALGLKFPNPIYEDSPSRKPEPPHTWPELSALKAAPE